MLKNYAKSELSQVSLRIICLALLWPWTKARVTQGGTNGQSSASFIIMQNFNTDDIYRVKNKQRNKAVKSLKQLSGWTDDQLFVCVDQKLLTTCAVLYRILLFLQILQFTGKLQRDD